MASPIRSLPVIQRWDCHSCTSCCRTYSVSVSEKEKSLIESWVWQDHPEMNYRAGIVHDPVLKTQRLNRDAEDACVFLRADGKCKIHLEFGESNKPLACRLYPFTVAPAGDHWRLGIRFACPSAAENKGRLLTEQSSELQKLLEAVESSEGYPSLAAGNVVLKKGQELPWPHVAKLTEALLKILDDISPLELRLRRLLAVSTMARMATLEKLSGKKLTEFLKIITESLEEEVPIDPRALARPSWVSRNIFRQLLAAYSRKDSGPEAGRSKDSRLFRIWSAWRFARGQGVVPKLHGQFNDGTFADCEKPWGGVDVDSDALLTRYFKVKLNSFQFFGRANFSRGYWLGLDSLLLVFPVVLWMARLFRKPEASPAEAVLLALRQVDDSFGFNPLLGGSRIDWATNVIFSRGDLARFIAWYAR